MNKNLHPLPVGAYQAQGTAWRFWMIGRREARSIVRRIMAGPRPGRTLAIWVCAQSYAEWNSGIIQATPQQLAEDAGTSPGEATRALSHLVELGALIRTARGRYALNPEVAWSGTLVARERALEPAE